MLKKLQNELHIVGVLKGEGTEKDKQAYLNKKLLRTFLNWRVSDIEVCEMEIPLNFNPK